MEVPSHTNIPALIAELHQEPLIELAEPNHYVHALRTPDDPQFSSQWHHLNTGQSGCSSGHDIRSTFAWNVTTGSVNVKIAIVDSGVDLNHADLSGNLISGYDFVDNDAVPQDGSGHGTHVAGIVAAVGDNTLQGTGVMWKASLMPIRVLDNTGLGTDAGVSQGIQYAADNGAKIINLSLGGPSPSSALEDAVNYATALGVLVVAAAGNNGDEEPVYPGYYSNAIAVAATNCNDVIAGFSSRGTWVDIAAPGQDILSSNLGGGMLLESGTSMACPVVSGIAGLILSRFPGLSLQNVRNRLLSGVDTIDAQNPGLAGKFGSGRINALKTIYASPSITSFTPVPNNPSIQNGSTISSFQTEISTDIAAPQVRVFLVDQLDREITPGNTVQYSVSGQINISGNIQFGNLSLQYPLVSQVKLRFEFNDGVLTTIQDAKIWNFQETSSVPTGGISSIWNGVFDPLQGERATVRLTLNDAGSVHIRVFTPNGTLVKTLADETVSSGVRTWDWAGDNDGQSRVASGVYLIHIQAPGLDEIKKVVLVK